jgi:subtilisin family serine protease
MKIYKYSLLFFIFLYSCQNADDNINNNVVFCEPVFPIIRNTPSGDSDPLYNQQWHLRNTGQKSYTIVNGTRGIDLNLPTNYTGSGVVVNIMDDGMEHTHEDLEANSRFDIARHFRTTDCPPTHGTSVAGIIAAEANNGVGGRGIAYEATLISYNFLGAQTGANFITSINDPSSDIINQSFGSTSREDTRLESFLRRAYKNGVENMRAGKGIIYTKAAGNEFEVDDFCQNLLTTAPITCQNANMSSFNNVMYNIVVAAVNANGIKASYSSAGSSILISGLGGEFGMNQPAIITTDFSGCNLDSDRLSRIPRTQDENCNYTNIFNATSAATPTVAGVAALMLEANSDLTWRDVRHILVHTARKIDDTRGVVETITNANVVADATAELGWVRNAAGLEFHNWYGFGLVDASAAVAMAETYSSSLSGLPDSISTSSPSAPKDIPDKSIVGAVDEIDFERDLTIEFVQIDLNITHTHIGDLGIFLKSPSNTESLLLNFNNFFRESDNLSIVLASQAFYGENAQGVWRLKIIDYLAEDTGRLENWELIIHGHR